MNAFAEVKGPRFGKRFNDTTKIGLCISKEYSYCFNERVLISHLVGSVLRGELAFVAFQAEGEENMQCLNSY